MSVIHLAAFAFAASVSACHSASPAPMATRTPTSATAAATAPEVAASAPLAVGDPAPDVTLTLQDGKVVALSSLRGARVLVYFYPKDETPGCTVEAEGLRDRYAELEAAAVRVIGVSVQDAESHRAFIANHRLPFALAVDDGAAVAKAFRVPLKGAGLAARQSFLIGKDGRLEGVWLAVDPATHAADVLARLK